MYQQHARSKKQNEDNAYCRERGGEKLNVVDKEMKTITDLSCWLRIHAVTKIIKLNNKVACRQSKRDLIIFELPILDEKLFPEPRELNIFLTLA